MKNNKIHLVPQVVIDCAEGAVNTKQDNLRLNYIMRLEAIRDYCDEVIKKTENDKRRKVPDWKITRDYCS